MSRIRSAYAIERELAIGNRLRQLENMRASADERVLRLIDALDALRYRHIRDSANNGYSLAGATGLGKWHVTQKVDTGEGEYLHGVRLDAAIDADVLAISRRKN